MRSHSLMPIPCPAWVDKLLDHLGKVRYSTALDLTKRYWQIPFMQYSKKKIMFATPLGHFQFTTMTFVCMRPWPPFSVSRTMYFPPSPVCSDDTKYCLSEALLCLIIVPSPLKMNAAKKDTNAASLGSTQHCSSILSKYDTRLGPIMMMQISFPRQGEM